jgi:cbb3-type cytochrome oxidase subunit 3
MMNLRKGYALLLVGMMVISGLVAFLSAPVVSADTELRADWIDLIYDTNMMFDEAEYGRDYADGSFFCLGEGDGVNDDTASTCTIVMNVSVKDDDVETLLLNISQYSESAFDFHDSDTTTDQIEGNELTGIADPIAGDVLQFEFTFDVLATSTLGTPSARDFTIRYWYWDQNAAQERSDTLSGVQIYIASVFDDPASDPDEQLSNAEDGNEDPAFEAGDMFEETTINLMNYDPGSGITDLTATVTEPGNGVTLSGGRNVCSIPNGIPLLDNDDLLYRTDVAVGTAPGVYSGVADITYERVDSGLPCTEDSLGVDWQVDFSFADDDAFEDGDLYSENQCRATNVTITDSDVGDPNVTRQADVIVPGDNYVQSTFSDKMIAFTVTIENNGNTPIYNCEFALPVDDAPLDPWPYFRNPRFFYPWGGAPPQYDSIAMRGIDLDVGETITFGIQCIVVKEIPIGEHRLPIRYDGFYYDDGSLGDATGFLPINDGDGVVGPDVDDLEIIFSIIVSDGALDCHVTAIGFLAAGEGADKLDIRSEVLTVSIQNDEEYNFIDVLATADFTGTPFYEPLVPDTTRNQVGIWAENANRFDTWDPWNADGVMDLEFRVDTDPTYAPDRYPFTITITAIIEETLETVTTTVVVGVEIDFTGYGPNIAITAFTGDDAIIPGEAFDLTITFTNEGDDLLRDVWIFFPLDDTEEYDWDLEQDFKEQFDWTDAVNMWTELHDQQIPDDMFYTVGDLDVDNIREIVEINLYMDGVYTPVGARIIAVHLIDLAPGASFDVTSTFWADKDMVNGKPYDIPVDIVGIEMDGDPYEETREIAVMTSLPGDSYNPVELDWFDAGLKLLGLVLFFIIVLAILLWVYNKFKGEPEEEEEEDFDFEDEEPASFEAAPKPAEKAPEELVTP